MTSMDAIDQASLNFKNILAEVACLDKKKWTESDTRLKVIDRILFEVLGWDKNESVKTEDQAGVGFTDYTMLHQGSARLVVEAKRDSIDFALGNRDSANGYKLNGPVFNTSAKEAIKQVIVYCAFKSCELACVTNGAEWIVFRANRLGDGKDILDGKGIIFSSLQSIESNFRVFFDLLSRSANESLRYRGEFQNVEGVPIKDYSFLKAPRNPATKKLLQRNEFASDFDAIMSSFFERLKGDQDPEMIQKCFVESHESDLADEKLTRIAEDLVEKVQHLNTGTGSELVALIEAAKLQHKNRFILLAGSKGAGKSTFIDRFFRFILPSQTADGLVLLRIDLSLSSGEDSSVVDWLNHRLIEECEKAIFSAEKTDWDEYIGKIFFDDYQRWSNATMSHLYKNDRNQFKIEFGRHVEKLRDTQSHEYIKKLVGYITKSNLKIPCLVFDNTDHFTIQFQETVFQYARSIYESEFCVVIMPITDKTSWQLSKQGALQSFESEVLSLPVPRADKVIERRITFVLDKLNIESEDQRKEYFLTRGIRLKLEDVGKFASGLNRIFVESKETATLMGGLANFDIRRLLELTKDVISSPHLKLDDLLKVHIVKTTEAVPVYKVKLAIIKRRYDIYPAGEHSFVQNMFTLCLDPPTSPLLGARILQFLCDVSDVSVTPDSQQSSFASVSQINEHFIAIGVPANVVNAWLNRMVVSGLVINYDPTILSLNSESLIEISPSGRIHLTWATADADYLQAMKDVTPLRSKIVFDQILDDYKDYKNKWQNSIKVFIDYLLEEDKAYCTIPEHSIFSGQTSIAKRLTWRKGRLN
ncbi:MAG: hypothetical protein WAW02_10885 [Sideroxyarcus sp.]